MKSIVLIIPYFGRLPASFPAWKASALNNPTVDFLFFTDIDGLQDEANIRTVHLSFGDFRKKIQSKFDFPISLEEPYKLCDYKPSYGYVLAEYIRDYDFWGHCDVDLIFGDIRKFVTDDILNLNRKIFEHGHFTLYRNDEETNTVFLRGPGYGDCDYKKAFTSDDSMYFDEFFGTMPIFRKENIPTYYNRNCFFEVEPRVKNFTSSYKNCSHVLFRYREGRLYALKREGEAICEEELLYAHFLKRKIDFSAFRPGENYYILPNRLVPGDDPPREEWFVPHGEALYRLQQKIRHVKEYWKRFRKGKTRSFLRYRRERKAFRYDLRDAKSQLEEYRKRE